MAYTVSRYSRQSTLKLRACSNPPRQLRTGTTMAFEAAILFQLVLLITWTCLSDTPFNQKNTLFAQFFTSQAALEEVASTASIVFCPDLFEVLQAVTPPTIQFFKSLPTDTSSYRWGIYAIVLEKPSCQSRVYIGSGTNTSGGVCARLKQYDDGLLLPRYTESSLNEGFTIIHKGLLCWIPKPTAAKRPVNRLLFFALEATFTYIFWAMKAFTRDYGMAYICLWDHNTLEYNGCCSHCALNEAIIGDFHLSAEELETQAIEKEQKRLAMKAENAMNHHYKQMATNYDEYIGEAGTRVARSRANNPGRDRVLQANRIEKAEATKTSTVSFAI